MNGNSTPCYIRDIEVDHVATIERQHRLVQAQAVVERYQLKSVTRQLAAAYKESLRLEMGNPKLEKQTTAAQSDRDRLSQREAELNKLAATQGLAPLYGEA